MTMLLREQPEVRILFPSDVAKTCPDWSTEECMRAADSYNLSEDKPTTVTLKRGTASRPVPEIHPFMDGFVAAMIGMLLFFGAGAPESAFGWGLCLVAGILLTFMTTIRTRMKKRAEAYVVVSVAPAHGSLSHKAAFVLGTKGTDEVMDISRSEMYERIEFLRNFKSERERLIRAADDLYGSNYEDEAAYVVKEHRETFNDCARWLSDAVVASSKLRILELEQSSSQAISCKQDEALLVLDEVLLNRPTTPELLDRTVSEQTRQYFRIYNRLR